MPQAIDQLKKVRIEKLNKLKEIGINPYPSKYAKEVVSIALARQKNEEEEFVVGRVMHWREHGGSIFADLKDNSGQIQLWFQEKSLKENFNILKLIDVGDFIGVGGRVTKTKSGEVTIDVSSFQILSKSLRPLPSEWYGIKDEETRYRERYVDILLNDDLKELFRKKSHFWNSMRQFLQEKGFLEVETPVLEATAGGADANPFITHHNALDIDLYLRISMGELWQKRLMVAGFEKTFEIGRQFRNEGISREHLQDYTQMEFYWAYANYIDSMKLVEEMYKFVAKETFGKLQFKIGEHNVDLSGNWKKIDYVETVLKQTGVNLSEASNEELKKKLIELKVSFGEKDDRGRLMDLLWKTVRKGISGPVFLVGHPVEVSPLAKRIEDRPGFVERYQVILAGSEMGNGYSELNDPIDQAERFQSQQDLRDKGDAEAQMFDADFVNALEYGMPPVSGFGISERLFSFLADLPIREAVLFPLLRPEENSKKSKQDFDQKLVIVIDHNLPDWQIMNTSAHAAAFLGNKMKSNFDTGKFFTTKDGVNLPRNSQYPIVTLSANKEELKNLMPAVRKSGLLHIGYVPEMMQTTNDKQLEQMLAQKEENAVVYTGIGIFGSKNEIDKLTKNFPLWGKNDGPSANAQVSQSKDGLLKISRSEALSLLHSKMQNENLRRHCLSVEVVMRALARHFKADEDKWGILGLLHDGDYELTKDNIEKHTIVMMDWLKNLGESDPELLQAFESHNSQSTGFPGPATPMEWSLFCCDELTGLIVAVALLRPNKKLSEVTVESILKKWNAKGFAAGAKREDIEMCVEKLGIPLNDFIQTALLAMQSIDSELGL